MRSIIMTLALCACTAAHAYTDGNGYHPPGECDIFTATCNGEGQEAHVTAYGRRMPASQYNGSVGGGGYNARAYCQRIVGESAVLMETCMQRESEAAERIGR